MLKNSVPVRKREPLKRKNTLHGRHDLEEWTPADPVPISSISRLHGRAFYIARFLAPKRYSRPDYRHSLSPNWIRDCSFAYLAHSSNFSCYLPSFSNGQWEQRERVCNTGTFVSMDDVMKEKKMRGTGSLNRNREFNR